MKNNIDWSRRFFNTVEIVFKEGGLELKALGEKIVFEGEIIKADCSGKISVKYSSDGSTVIPEFKAEEKCILEEYHYFDGEWKDVGEIEIARTKYNGIGAFLRKNGVSFFLSFDFPFSKIEDEGNVIKIGCDPKDEIKAGRKYMPHTLTTGAAKLTGKKIGKFDVAEIEAFSEYILSRMPEKFRGDRPIYSTTCITNRMTDLREGRVFYSMYDNPTLTLDTETLKKEVRLCGELGIEYYQAFEGYYDWEEDGSTERNLKELVELGEKLGVRVGDYMTTLGLNCWHYNYHNRSVNDPEMDVLLEEDYQNGTNRRWLLCYGSKKTTDYLKNTIVESIKRNREQMICLDGDCGFPCFDESHGHNKGSLYAHVRGLCEFMQAINDTSPYFMTWSNAGNWIEFMPKLLWFNQNVYLTDPHPRNYSASLNNLKYYGDCRREQMVTVHNKYFVPYCVFTNCEYYAFRHSRVDDMAFFEYSFLQGFAVTPNICLGEMRTFFERVSSKKLPYVKSFIKKWLKFFRDNIDCWKYVYQLGDAPDAGANEAYAHINGNRGYVCFVNQNQCSNRFVLKLDKTAGLAGKEGDRFLLSEVYPEEKVLSNQPLNGALYGDEITFDVPGNSVVYIKIEPYSKPRKARLYGIGGKMKETDDGFVFEIDAASGITPDTAVLTNAKIKEITVETAWNVPKYKFPSDISDLKICKNAARFKLMMPRDLIENELPLWTIDGSEEKYRLSLANSDFCGGYVHNLYKENQKVFLKVTVDRESCCKDGKPCDDVLKAPEAKPIEGNMLPPTRHAKEYETDLKIPFIEWPAMSCMYGLDEIAELVFADNVLVNSVKAYINGNEIPVYEYRYPSARHMKAYYIELTGEVGSGTVNKLKVCVDWNEEAVSKKFSDCEKDDGPAGEAKVIGK